MSALARESHQAGCWRGCRWLVIRAPLPLHRPDAARRTEADVDLPIESARLHVAAGDNDTAIAIGHAAHTADPGDADIAEFLAGLLEKANDPASALEVLRRADSILPLQVRQHRLHFARLLSKAGERVLSIDHCDGILATDPTCVPVLSFRCLYGRLRCRIGRGGRLVPSASGSRRRPM